MEVQLNKGQKMSVTIRENDIKSFQVPMETEMDKTIKHFERELVKIRTGQAHTTMVEDIQVSCYSQPPVPLKTLAALAAPDQRLITIQPWDASIIDDIEKAIQNSDFGVTPLNDGKVIRLQLPEVSADRRSELIKVLGKRLEECKVAIRNVRKDYNNHLRDAKKNKSISEDFANRLDDIIKKVTETYIEKATKLADKKEKSIANV